MLFVAPEFASFFLVVLLVAWLLRQHIEAWKTFVIAASLFFYGWWRREADDWVLAGIGWLPRYVCYLLAFGFVNHALARLAGRGRGTSSRFAVLAACCFDLGALFYFKYFEWTRSVLNEWFGAQLTPTNIILPIGISFIAFQGLGYVVDVHRGTQEPVAIDDFFTYLFFFPHLVAGPLVRVGEFAPQIRRADPRVLDASRAFWLIGMGFVKKVIISAYVSKEIVGPVFANPKGSGGVDSLLAAYAYSVQIFCDFSGYTDIAIGLALLLGIRFPPNFDNPYRAVTIQDFWRRWHMTLSRWLRDYLYIGLGGNRRGHLRTYVNLFLTMFLGGIWHGANWTFVVWGTIHGVALAAERALVERYGPARSLLAQGLHWFVTFHVVTLAWVFFNARDVAVARTLLGNIARLAVFDTGHAAQYASVLLVAVIVAVVALQFVPAHVPREIVIRFGELPAVAQGAVLGGVVIACYRLGSVDEFIYFQF